MSDPALFTPARTRAHAYLFAHVLRAILQCNRAALGERWSHLGTELQHALRPIINGAPSVPEAISAIASRWGLSLSTGQGTIRVLIPRAIASAWDLARLSEPMEGGDPTVDTSRHATLAWHQIAVRLDHERVRIAVNASPHIFAALAREFVAFEDRFAFVDDLTYFDWIADGDATGAPIDIADFASPTRYWTRILLRSPLAHGGDAGGSNIAAMRREDRVDLLTGAVHPIPFVAGNAVRGLMRDVAVAEYLRVLGLTPQQIRPTVAHALLAGGAIAAGETMGAADNELRARLRRLCPVVDLFGGCIESQLMQGVLLVGDAVLVCRETAAMVAPAMGWTPNEAALAAPTLPRADACVVQRHATRRHHPEIEGPTTQMIMHTEAIGAGHVLAHDLAFRTGRPTEIQSAALQVTLARMAEHGVLGGKNQAGFGEVAWGDYQDTEGRTFKLSAAAARLYEDYVRSVAEEAHLWLVEGFPVVAKPAKPAKRGKGQADAPVAV